MQITKKPKDWPVIVEQARKNFDEASLRELMLSMETYGQLQPIGVKPDGSVIWGERRLRSTRMSDKITEVVVCITADMTETDFKVISLTENLMRQSLTPCESWRAAAELMCMNPTWKGKDLAAKLKVDPSTVTRILSPSYCIPAVQEAFQAGRLGMSDCYAISKADEKGQHELLALKLGGASRDELESRRKRTVRHDSAKAARVTIPLPDASIIISGKELSMSSVVDALADALKEAKKAADQYDVKTFSLMMKDRAKS